NSRERQDRSHRTGRADFCGKRHGRAGGPAPCVCCNSQDGRGGAVLGHLQRHDPAQPSGRVCARSGHHGGAGGLGGTGGRRLLHGAELPQSVPAHLRRGRFRRRLRARLRQDAEERGRGGGGQGGDRRPGRRGRRHRGPDRGRPAGYAVADDRHQHRLSGRSGA
ncbi:hypothetical protein LTR94_030324, partial [Friedmanniomyces endolithicus]